MTSTLFVCYNHGCKGERLSVALSQHPLFETLHASRVRGRTVIRNDHFHKALLHSWKPRFDELTNRSGANIVVPSHWFYDDLSKHYPNECYLSIDVPKDMDQYHTALYERFYLYRTTDVAEILGECENRLRESSADVSDEEVKSFAARVLAMKDVTFGDIRCMAMGIPATEANQRMLVQKHKPLPLTDNTKNNSLVIPYEQVDDVDVDEVVSYFNRCRGSL